ncbi:MAG: hypothetical protein J0M12_17435 [Deltaproteobacteria bacterium]|nr:hypothetical protein [Deltaproteobacteria bacterium]
MTYLRTLVLTLGLGAIVGCSSGMQVPTDDSRASLSPNAYNTAELGTEEPDAEVRATILEKVQRYLLKTGQYPKSSVENVELLSLVPTFTTIAPESSTWNYRALVRVNVRESSTLITFLTFDRDGELVLRRISA